jgi:choline dehydrogenase-like flavoprotein
MSTTETDAVIIGSGAAGAVIAKRLSDDGINVVCLEQGDWVHPHEHPHSHDEWELEKLRGWSFDPNMRNLPEDYPVTGDATTMMFNAVGGSTVHYLAFWPRMKPVDFRKGTEHGLGNTIDWPISYEELEPYYAQAEHDVGISGFQGDPAYPAMGPKPGGPSIAPGISGLRGIRAFDELGWHWFPGDNAIVTGNGHKGRLPCNACGNCSSGCPRGSMGSMHVTHWPQALANGVDLRTSARVSQVLLDAKGLADGVEYIDMRTDERHQVKAKMVFLCASGIGSPRLLQLSAQRGHPDGLANSSGQVGHNLMHHTYAFMDIWLEEPMYGWQGGFGGNSYSHEFYDTDTSRGFANGFTLFAGNGRSYGAGMQSNGFATGYMTPWGNGHREFFDSHFGFHNLVGVQGEDLPMYDNAVTLDPEATDSSGLAAPHIEYKLCEHDKRLTEYGAARAVEVAEAMGAVESNPTGVVWPPPAWHLMGTARMGNTPEDSVVNKYHQTWDVPNLFVCDGSSLATGGAVNPTCTISALALRCADYVARRQSDILSQTTTPSNADAPGF